MLAAKTNQSRKNLSNILDEFSGAQKDVTMKVGRRSVNVSKGETTITIDMLREHMKNNETFDRIVDVFAKLDTDGSGFVDENEFQEGVQAIIENCNKSDVLRLFQEIDVDNNGQISYLELKEAFRAADERTAKAKFTVPALPHNLQRRRRDIISLFRHFEKEKQQSSGRPPPERTKSVPLGSFADCLKLYYPKDSKEDIVTIDKWMSAYLVAKESADEAKTRIKDEELIASLDVDGDQRISIAEFVEPMSKSTGLSKTQMRARFRDKDIGNTGFLSMQQMRDVLHEMREEGKNNKKS